jgi:hypothetical protein
LDWAVSEKSDIWCWMPCYQSYWKRKKSLDDAPKPYQTCSQTPNNLSID